MPVCAQADDLFGEEDLSVTAGADVSLHVDVGQMQSGVQRKSEVERQLKVIKSSETVQGAQLLSVVKT